jgi:hypothetical protein
MPTALAMDRTRVCTYTFENSSKCRIPLTSHPYLCTFHARKDAEERATDEAVRDIAFHLSNRYISHCDLSAAIAQTITAVAYNHIPVRTAATIAYLTQNLVQSLAGAEKEFKDTFGIYAWRQTIADNFNTPRPNNSAVQPAPAEPAATAPQPVPTDDRANDPASTPATDATTNPQIPSAQPPGESQQTRAENSAEKEAENGAENNSKRVTGSSQSGVASNPDRTAASDSVNGTENNAEANAQSNSEREAESDSESDGSTNSAHASSDSAGKPQISPAVDPLRNSERDTAGDSPQIAAKYGSAPAPSTTTPPAPPPRPLEPRPHLPSQQQIEAALTRLRAAMATQ